MLNKLDYFLALNDVSRQEGETLYTRADHLRHIRYYNEQLEIDEDNQYAWRNKGTALYYLENYTEAIYCFDRSLVLDENDIDSQNNKASALRKLGQYTEAISWFDKALSQNENFKPALNGKGLTLCRLENYEQAISYFDKALSKDKYFQPAWIGKGNALSSLAQYVEAINCFDQVLTLNKNNKNALNGKGDALSNLGQYTEAVDCYNRVLMIDKQNKNACHGKGIALNNLKQYDRALKYFNRILAVNETHKYALNGKGFALSNLGNYQDAIDYYNKALLIDKNYKLALLNKGVLLYHYLQQYTKAINCFNQVLAIDENNIHALNGKGFALNGVGQYTEAINCFNQVLQIQISNIDALKGKGMALGQSGNYVEALDYFEQVLLMDESNQDVLSNKGFVLNCLGQYTKAIHCFNQALAMDENNKYALNGKGIALANLGLVKVEQSKYKDAFYYYDKALEINEHFTYALSNKLFLLLLQMVGEENNQQVCESVELHLVMLASLECNSIWYKTLLELYHFASKKSCYLFELLQQQFKRSENQYNLRMQFEIYLAVGKFFLACNALAQVEIYLEKAFNLTHHQKNSRLIALKEEFNAIKKNLSNENEKFWHFDSEAKVNRPAPGIVYELVEATDKDKRKVIQFYQHHPVPGYDVGSVEVIYNPNMNHLFSLNMQQLQQRYANSAFKPKWSTGQENEQVPMEAEENVHWRAEIYQQFSRLARPWRDNDYPALSLMPMWHGTKKQALDGIFRTGYANLKITDVGFFGAGIYSAYEAEYAWRVYAERNGKKDAALILNWTVCFSPYPVIYEDMEKKFVMQNEAGQKGSTGNYSNYDAHFVPVVPQRPDNPNETIYYPTKPGQSHQYTELVVFQTNACLPRYLVKLQPTLIPYPGLFFTPVEENQEKNPAPKQKNFGLSNN